MLNTVKQDKLKIKISAGMYLVLGFVVFVLATSFFPFALPGETAWFYLSAAIITGGGILGAILLYELVQAVVARKFGYKVEGIALSFLGNKQFEREEPRTARHAFWISAVGLLTLAAMATVGLGLGYLLVGSQPATALVLTYLGGLSLIFTAFNLLPAPPLPGGKILRALVWGATRSEDKAGIVYANAGRVTGWLVVLVGVTVLLLLSVVDGLIVMLVGWLLLTNSRVAKFQHQITVGLRGITAEQVVNSDGQSVQAQMPLKEVLPLLWQREAGRVIPVLDNGYLQGVIDSGTVQSKVRQPQTMPLTVADVMVRRGSLLIVRPQEEMTEVIKKMTANLQGFAVVLDDWGYFKGTVYLRDIPRYVELSQYLKFPLPTDFLPPANPPTVEKVEEREKVGTR
jgi:Zn-dependent protease/CBS domain-containing protein